MIVIVDQKWRWRWWQAALQNQKQHLKTFGAVYPSIRPNVCLFWSDSKVPLRKRKTIRHITILFFLLFYTNWQKCAITFSQHYILIWYNEQCEWNKGTESVMQYIYIYIYIYICGENKRSRARSNEWMREKERNEKRWIEW